MAAFSSFTGTIKRGTAFSLPFIIERGEPASPEPVTAWSGWRFLLKRHYTDADGAALVHITPADGGWSFDDGTGLVNVVGSGTVTRTLPNRRHRLYGSLQGINPDGEPEEFTGMVELEPEGVQATS